MQRNKFSSKLGTTTSLLAVAGLCSFNAFAAGSIGAVFGTETSEYKDYDSNGIVFPMIHYEDNLFYFHALSGGLFLFKNDYSAVTVGLSYFPKEFDASNSSDVRLQQLDDRNSTGMVDIGYRYTNPLLGTVSAVVSADFLDETDGGWKAEFSYKKTLPLSEQFSIVPGFGVNWYNRDLNEHYYGISASESARSTLNEYHPDSSLSTYAELSANLLVTENVSLFVSGKYIWLDSEVTNSPMVDSNHYATGLIGVNFTY